MSESVQPILAADPQPAAAPGIDTGVAVAGTAPDPTKTETAPVAAEPAQAPVVETPAVQTVSDAAPSSTEPGAVEPATEGVAAEVVDQTGLIGSVQDVIEEDVRGVLRKFHVALSDLLPMIEQGITKGAGELRAILSGMEKHL